MDQLSIHGFFGMRNFGDDLFCCTAEQVVAENLSGVRPFLAAPRLEGCGLEPMYPRAFPAAWFSRPGLLGASVRLITGARAFAKTSTLVLAGGSVASRLAGVRRAQARASKLIAKQWIALGISVGPFADDSDQSMVSDFLHLFDFIGVRDSASFERCRAFGLDDRTVMMGDLVGLLRWPQSSDERADGRVVLVPCRSASEESWDNLLRLAGESGHPVAILSLNSHPEYGDDVLAKEGHELMVRNGTDSVLLRYDELGVVNAWNVLGSARAVISGRLHGAICAYLQEVPFALIDYQEKCREFLDDIGADEDARVSSPRGSEWFARIVSGGLPAPALSSDQYRHRAHEAINRNLERLR